ncbi:MAG: thiamine diphosphokinase, partial [Lachnospiraceae bacterium]|nr:thiamine diphosphokinase [Lachnospiraceae bacterium]
MKKTACIVTGGTLSAEYLSRVLCRLENPLLIVVDGALEVTHRLGLVPDYIVGDFDTVDQS